MKKPKYRLFTVLSVICLILGILMTTVGGHFSTVLTVAMEGSTTDKETAETTYADGLAMNVELEEEGLVLLKNENQTLPLSAGKVNVFGEHAFNMVYNGSGSSAGNANGAVTIKEGLEAAGLEVNEGLLSFIEENTTSETDNSVHEGNSVDISGYPINEMPVEKYTGDYSFDKIKEYSDTAIVVIGRVGGEGQDLPRTGFGADGTESYLELNQNEKNLLKTLKENGFKTIVLINSSYAMELGFIDQQNYGVEAAMWVGGPGIAGATAIGEALTGKVNPSGRLVDTYAYDLTTQSTYHTSDYNYYYSAEDAKKILGGFSNYSEGIYMGYRWYETADAEGFWDTVSNEFGSGYEGVVQYPFGYGMSYTSFSQKIVSAEEEDGVVNFEVEVTNTGDTYAGKDVIQLYCEAPYTQGGTEKSKVVLAAFEKTDVLQPDETKNYNLSVALEDVASYDETAADGKGAYTLDAGAYEFYLSENAHSWSDIETQDTEKCYEYALDSQIVYDESNKRSSDQTAASNQFADAKNDIPTLSRADGFANAKETVFSKIDDIALEKSDAIYDLLINKSSAAGEYQGEILDTTTGAEQKYTMDDMAGAAYDDEKWDELISQMSVSDMITLIGTGGWSTPAIDSIGKAKTTDIDGPYGLSNFVQNELGNSESVCVSYCSEVVVASTWNKELVNRYGQTVGNEGNATGVSGWYAPGANLHRSSFSGRNPEYYSEDSYLSGVMCANMVEGALSRGLYVYVKHFAFNDQEANRTNKENCWMSEQTAREIYLKPFELAVKDGGATGLMASYMWFEGKWCGGDYNLMTTVVRNEWGFTGMVVTDNYCGTWMNPTKAIMAGTDLILSNASREVDADVAQTDEGISAMKQSCKNILFTIADAAGKREIAARAGFDWWGLTYISTQIIFYGCAALFAVIAYIKYRKWLKNAVTVEIEE